MGLNPVTGTDHDGLCECCDEPLTEVNLIEGDLGFYCSDECCEESEDQTCDDYREDFCSGC